MSKPHKREDDPTTIQVPRWVHRAIKEKKRGDETYADFFRRRLQI